MDELRYQAQLIHVFIQDQQRMQIWQIAANFCQKNHLNDWCLGAGFVRNLVWDHLHSYTEATLFHDIDLIYFNPASGFEDIDLIFEQELKQQLNIHWPVKKSVPHASS